MSAKGEMKNLSTKKYEGVEMEPMNVDNSPIFTENSKSGNLRYPGQAITEFAFQSCTLIRFLALYSDLWYDSCIIILTF